MSTRDLIIASHVKKTVYSAEKPITILEDINLQVESGSSLAIQGVSGSGKSTLLSLLAGLDLPTSGTIQFADQELTALDEDGRAKIRSEHLGFVFQSFQLIPTLTALENVMLPLEIRDISDAKSRAISCLEGVGLADRLSHYPIQLSGGEQQRVSIARAFANLPHVLFADEPTGDLDQKTSAHIQDVLFELNEKHKITLIIATHDQILADRCQQHYLLEQGTLVCED